MAFTALGKALGALIEPSPSREERGRIGSEVRFSFAKSARLSLKEHYFVVSEAGGE